LDGWKSVRCWSMDFYFQGPSLPLLSPSAD